MLVGGNASIVDFDFHPLTPEGRVEAINAGAGSVVTQDVPPRTVVAGNPPSVVREL